MLTDGVTGAEGVLGAVPGMLALLGVLIFTPQGVLTEGVRDSVNTREGQPCYSSTGEGKSRWGANGLVGHGQK